jgi:hypothetical protein
MGGTTQLSTIESEEEPKRVTDTETQKGQVDTSATAHHDFSPFSYYFLLFLVFSSALCSQILFELENRLKFT